MRILLFGCLVMSAASAFANTTIYTCEPHNDDGDAYGETLVIGVVDAVKGSTARTLNLLSDYLGASTGISKSTAASSTSVTFSGFDTSAYDKNGTFVKNLKVTVPRTVIEKSALAAVIKLTDADREGVEYSCKRISE